MEKYEGCVRKSEDLKLGKSPILPGHGFVSGSRKHRILPQ